VAIEPDDLHAFALVFAREVFGWKDTVFSETQPDFFIDEVDYSRDPEPRGEYHGFGYPRSRRDECAAQGCHVAGRK
jgi:hypothetical protein